MAEKRWIDIETAKTVLKRQCPFLEPDDSKIADFKIMDGQEAVLMSIYTSAFFVLDENHTYKFGYSSDEPLHLMPLEYDIFPSMSAIPLLAEPISSYFKFFPEIKKPKYLFMVDMTAYRPRKYGDATYKDSFHKQIKKNMLTNLKREIESSGLKLSDCIIWPSTYDGTYGEDFWEYMCGVVLRRQGYFVGRHGFAGGDLFAYYILDYWQELLRKKLLFGGGAFLEELEMVTTFKPEIFDFPFYGVSLMDELSNKKFESIIIEAEPNEQRIRTHSEKSGIGQLEKYLSKSDYTHGYVAGAFAKWDEKFFGKKIGLISCDGNGNITVHEPEAYRKPSQEHIESVKNLIKAILLKNLSFEERLELLGGKPNNIAEYYANLSRVNLEKILNKIEGKTLI